MSLPRYKVVYISEPWSAPYCPSEAPPPGHVVQCGDWGSTDEFMEGAVPGRYRFYDRDVKEEFDLIVNPPIGLHCVVPDVRYP